jgi:hypothetical protein
MKKIVQIITLTVIAATVIIACKDNFSEQDFLNSQNKQKTLQDSLNAKALNDAGQLLSYTLQVLDDKTPVTGVAVTMTNPPKGTATATLTATTDATGTVQFKNVQIGANTFIISKTGYYPATFIVDFGPIQNGINYTIVNGSVVPVKKSASNQVPIFASASGTGSSTATIRGNVTIETNLTNTTPEIPQGLVLKANLSGITNGLGGNGGGTANGQGTIVQYFFNTNAIGTATVDNTTGAYSMVVPAGADGRTITMIYPVISANQIVGFNRLNGVTTNAQISSTVPAIYGPSSLVGSYDAVPSVSGVTATFSPAAPPAPGSGLKFNFTPVPRSFPTGFSFPAYSSTVSLGGNTILQMTNRGSGYTASPAVTFSGGGSPTTQATATTSIGGTATLSITNGGSNYTGTVTFTLQHTNNGGTTFSTTFDAIGNVVSFNANVGASPVALSSSNVIVPTTGPGFGIGNLASTGSIGGVNGFGVNGFRWVITGGGAGTGATATASLANGFVEGINITAGGTGYTSTPTITIAAGGTSTAALSVIEFGTQWNVALDNSAITPYSVTPANIQFAFTSPNFGNSLNSSVVDQFLSSTGINNAITVSGGNVVFNDLTRTYTTSSFSQSAPVAQITPSLSIPALANVTVGSTLGSPNFGQITSVSSASQNGRGYNVLPTLAITPVAGTTGSGAVAQISQNVSFNSNTKEYTWNGNTTVTNPGSGYQPFVNMYWAFGPYGLGAGSTAGVPFSGTVSIPVRTGDVVVVDVSYGTGQKKQNIN